MTGGSSINYGCLEIVNKFVRYTFLLATLFIQLKGAQEANETLPSLDYTTVRLVNGGDPWIGRVEVYYNGQWGTVCDDGWTIKHARVVCRQLGFDGALAAYSRAKFGQGQTLPILLEYADCWGNESRIQDCHGNWGGWNNCDHSEDAGVECQADEDKDILLIAVNAVCTACVFIFACVFFYETCPISCQDVERWLIRRRIARRRVTPQTITVMPVNTAKEYTQTAAQSHNSNTSTVENISVPPALPTASVLRLTACLSLDGEGEVNMTGASSVDPDLPPSYDSVMAGVDTSVPPS